MSRGAEQKKTIRLKERLSPEIVFLLRRIISAGTIAGTQSTILVRDWLGLFLLAHI